MKISIRTKLVLSYAAIIALTLVLLGWITEEMVGRHLDSFPSFFEAAEEGRDHHPKAKFLDSVRKSIALTAFVSGSIAIVLSYLIASYILQPVEDTIAATKAIAKGRYRKRIKVRSDDEMGELTQAVNEMAESLEENERLRKELISNLSHELATPLTSVSGYLEALNDGLIKGKKEQGQAFELMQEECQRLKKMITDMRTLAIIEEPRFTLNLKAHDPRKLCQRVIKQMEPSFQQKQVRLLLQSPKSLPKLQLDRDRFIQILMNLLSNALKFTAKEGQVTVRLRKSGASLTMDVEDSGMGIPKKDLKYIFERFYRTDKSRHRDTGGTGIGLSIVKELVEAHGGSIKAKSGPKGSTFTCRFPLIKN